MSTVTAQRFSTQRPEQTGTQLPQAARHLDLGMIRTYENTQETIDESDVELYYYSDSKWAG